MDRNKNKNKTQMIQARIKTKYEISWLNAMLWYVMI